MHQDMIFPSDEVALSRCQDLPPVSVVTTIAPVGAQEALYVATYDQLYAVQASDGMVLWCQQVKPTREVSNRPDMPLRRPPHLLFGTP